MKAKKSKGKPAAKRATKDLPPKKAGEVKGGSIATQEDDSLKAIVRNIRG
jgi:hypothetical protein